MGSGREQSTNKESSSEEKVGKERSIRERSAGEKNAGVGILIGGYWYDREYELEE